MIITQVLKMHLEKSYLLITTLFLIMVLNFFGGFKLHVGNHQFWYFYWRSMG